MPTGSWLINVFQEDPAGEESVCISWVKNFLIQAGIIQTVEIAIIFRLQENRQVIRYDGHQLRNQAVIYLVFHRADKLGILFSGD